MGKNLNNKLNIWGINKIIHKDGRCYPEDYYCVRCYKKKKEVPAVKFYAFSGSKEEAKPHCNFCMDELENSRITYESD